MAASKEKENVRGNVTKGSSLTLGDTLFDTVAGESDPVIHAAWLYYHEALTQAEIAQRLGVSRPSVANMLARAREEGVVRISVRPDYLSALTLAKELRGYFGLQDALIVPSQDETGTLYRSLGQAGALYLEGVLSPGDVLATAWGATVLEVARALSGESVPDLTIAQALGGLSTAAQFNPGKVASIMADKLGARAYHLYVPAVVESAEVRDILLRDRFIRSAFEVAKGADKGVFGVGKMAHDATVVRAGFVTPHEIDELAREGAVGDLAGRFFGPDGRPVHTELSERLIALSLDEMRAISPLIVVAGGQGKAEAILGALRGSYIDVLITDERTARRVLALDRDKGDVERL